MVKITFSLFFQLVGVQTKEIFNHLSLVWNSEYLLGPFVIGSGPQWSCWVADLQSHNKVTDCLLDEFMTMITVRLIVSCFSAMRTPFKVPFFQCKLINMNNQISSCPFLITQTLNFIFQLSDSSCYFVLLGWSCFDFVKFFIRCVLVHNFLFELTIMVNFRWENSWFINGSQS